MSRDGSPPASGVTFTVAGVPAPQGSKTRTRYGMREANAATRPWREAVAWEATTAMKGRDLLTGPLMLDVGFYFQRPKSHYSAKGGLRDSAPAFHASKPDTDKLLRAIGDGLTGIVCRDDSQIAWVYAKKMYGVPRAVVFVCELIRPP